LIFCGFASPPDKTPLSYLPERSLRLS